MFTTQVVAICLTGGHRLTTVFHYFLSLCNSFNQIFSVALKFFSGQFIEMVHSSSFVNHLRIVQSEVETSPIQFIHNVHDT